MDVCRRNGVNCVNCVNRDFIAMYANNSLGPLFPKWDV
jgi:hypothetical protein